MLEKEQLSMDDPRREWIRDFEWETGLVHDPRTVRTEKISIDGKFVYEQFKFCIRDAPDECYIMLKDRDEAFDVAYYIASNYDQDYWHLSYDDLLQEVNDDLCKILSGEDFGCEITGSGQYYWQDPR